MMGVIGWSLEVCTYVADNRPPWLYPEPLLCSSMLPGWSSATAAKGRARRISLGQEARRDALLTDGI